MTGLNFGDNQLSFGDSGPTFGTEPSPFESVEYTGDLAQDSQSEVDALHDAFRKREANERKRFKTATDTEFWFAVYFKDREFKERFLRGINAAKLGDKYINGHALAEILGIEIGGDPDGSQ